MPDTSPLTDQDRAAVRRALELAEGGRGRVSPNPLVGAVVVRDGRTIGEGLHERLGGPHAEAAALADARRRGEDPRGATVYVTLEPCAHEGRQPVTLKSALSLDGRTATESGDSRWISGERSRALVHRWRAEVDAVAIGIGTALADDPLLTARPEADPAAPGGLAIPASPGSS